MVDSTLIAAKLAELGDRIERVRARLPRDAGLLAGDRDAFEIVSFNLMLAVQACLDIASHLISDQGWPPASTLGGAFERLGERGVLDQATAQALRRSAGLRNIVAHGYAQIDPALIHSAALAGIADLERFAHQVGAWTRGH